ncbi:MAG: glutaredoxin family protein [Synechococcales cyanobacterium]
MADFTLYVYSKPGCHLCTGLLEKLTRLPDIAPYVHIRDITTSSEWWEQYQYEIPVLVWSVNGAETPVPRPSPRESPERLRVMLMAQLAMITGSSFS